MTKPRCAFPGCKAGLYPNNTSGLCRIHTHAVGLCRCHACTATAPAPTIAERGDVRVVEVPYPTSNSGVALKARVSLKREPWASA